jgi:hypothetical protein
MPAQIPSGAEIIRARKTKYKVLNSSTPRPSGPKPMYFGMNECIPLYIMYIVALARRRITSETTRNRNAVAILSRML